MQKQKLIILIAGVVLGLIAVVMVSSYIKDMEKTSKREAAKALEKLRDNQAVVLVANRDIPANTPIQGSMVEASIVPREYVQPQAATSLDRISGMLTVAPISRGEQVSLTKLASVGQTTKHRDLSSLTPPGKRAVSVIAENISEVSSLIRPGDNIDLIAVLSMPKEIEGKKVTEQTIIPAFQNVLILAVGQETDSSATLSKSQKEKINQITVALGPTEASIMTFLQDQGKIRISLRSAQDSVVEKAQPVTWESVLQYLPSLKPKEEPEVETIDIYRGTNKGKMPISQ
ncbi:MAG: Flp pilus assembly protein CpaB [Candidatus Omnitrophica bacterium]|nr:Flp pilus assembly protein CpaB [Candidatus Omnitrophota bacterium]